MQTRLLAHDVVDLFENSVHFAEELIRRPELIEELLNAREANCRSITGDLSAYDSRRRRIAPVLSPRDASHSGRECLPACRRSSPRSDRTSDLADAVICTAYTLARDQVYADSSARIARLCSRRTR